MLQPGTCSARSSARRTCAGPPGACATCNAATPSVGGATLEAAHATHGRAVEAEREEVRPFGCREGVGVEVRDQFAGRGEGAFVASDRQACVREFEEAGAGVPAGDVSRRVLRAVVDDDDLEAGVVEVAGVSKALVEGVLGVEGTHDDRHRGPVVVEVAHRSPVPATGDVERGPWPAFGIGQTETPTLDLLVAHPPVVGPREEARSRDPSLDRHLELPVERLGLSLFARFVRTGGQPEFAEDERPVAREVLEPGQIAPELGAFLEVDVERDEVDATQLEVLRRRVVRVGDQHVGVDIVGNVDERVDQTRDGGDAVPPDDVGGKLVAEGESEQLRPAGKLFHQAPDLGPHVLRCLLTLPSRRPDQVPPIGANASGKSRSPCWVAASTRSSGGAVYVRTTVA